MTAQVQGQSDSRSPSRSSSRSRRSRNRWLRRLVRAFGYLIATCVGLIGLMIGIVGVNSGHRSGDPGDTWAGLIIGGIFVFTAIFWYIWLMGRSKRHH